MSTLDEMREAMFGSASEELPKLDPDIERIRLIDSAGALIECHKFAVGDLVRQKPLARIYTQLGDNDQGIVLEVLREPIVNEAADAYGGPHYREHLDLVVGVLRRTEDEGDYFLRYHVDSRRFEPAT